MNTVLVIASAAATRAAWCLAVRAKGMVCREASGLLGARDDLNDPRLAGIVFDSQTDDDLAALIALSTVHPLPPVVIVSPPSALAMSSRFTAGTIVDSSTSIPRLVARLAGLVRTRPLSSPTHLPVRLSRATDAQWTVRLSAALAEADDDSFDGATRPDGFELALRA